MAWASIPHWPGRTHLPASNSSPYRQLHSRPRRPNHLCRTSSLEGHGWRSCHVQIPTFLAIVLLALTPRSLTNAAPQCRNDAHVVGQEITSRPYAIPSVPGHPVNHRAPTPCYICFHLVPLRLRTRTDSTPAPEDSTMSIAPLSARLFRFLAVVASAQSIVLMLGTGTQADPTTSLSLSPAYSSKALKSSQPFTVIPVQMNVCRDCREYHFHHYMLMCNRTDHQCVMEAHYYACYQCRNDCREQRC